MGVLAKRLRALDTKLDCGKRQCGVVAVANVQSYGWREVLEEAVGGIRDDGVHAGGEDA